jgi:uncharacterized OB-fold protein
MSRRIEPITLPRTGTLYSFTVLRVGTTGEPRVLGYVDLDNGVRVLAEVRPGAAALVPDLPVELGLEDDGQWFFEVKPQSISAAQPKTNAS